MEKAMDFSTLSRRELQALCKKNKIPANITNVAMIEALNALEKVEGIEEVLNPGESEMEQSPEKNVKTQQSVSRTSCRTSTRIKPAREVDESQKNLTTARRQGTSRKIAGDVEQAAVSAAPAVRSSRKKAPVAVAETAEDQIEKGIKTIPLTPAATPATLRRGTRVSSRRNINSDLIEEKKVYSTRRSVRMSVKKVVDSDFSEKETTQPIKMDVFSEDMSEVSETTVVNHLGDVLPTLSEESSEITDVSAHVISSVDSEMQELLTTDLVMEEAKQMESIEVNVISGVEEQSGESVADETEDLAVDVDSNKTELETTQDLSEDAEIEPVPEVEEQYEDDNAADESEIEQDLELSFAAKVDSNAIDGEIKVDSIESVVEIVSNIKLDSDKYLPADLSEDVTDDADIEPVPEVEEQSDDNNAADESEIEQDLELSFAAKVDSNEIDGEIEVDSIESVAEIVSNNELDSDNTLPAADFSFQNEKTTVLDEIADEAAMDSDCLSDNESDFSTDSELDGKDDVNEESEAEAETTKDELSVKTVKATTPGSVKKSTPIEIDFSALILADDEPLPLSSSLLKKSLSPSPFKKSARVLDDKENTDHLSGKKLELTKQKRSKSKKNDDTLEDVSLRQLSKMLKVKLQITNKNKNSMNNETECNADEAVNMRPALQALPENQTAGGELKMEN